MQRTRLSIVFLVFFIAGLFGALGRAQDINTTLQSEHLGVVIPSEELSFHVNFFEFGNFSGATMFWNYSKISEIQTSGPKGTVQSYTQANEFGDNIAVQLFDESVFVRVNQNTTYVRGAKHNRRQATSDSPSPSPYVEAQPLSTNNYMFKQPLNYTFANESRSMRQGGFKFALYIENWVFSKPDYSLQVLAELAFSQACNFTEESLIYTPGGNATQLAGIHIKGQLQAWDIVFAQNALIDDIVKPVIIKKSGNMATIDGTTYINLQFVFPQFASFLLYDPDINALLDGGDKNGDGGDGVDTSGGHLSDGEDDNKDLTTILVAVLIPIAAVAVLSVVIVLIIAVITAKVLSHYRHRHVEDVDAINF